MSSPDMFDCTPSSGKDDSDPLSPRPSQTVSQSCTPPTPTPEDNFTPPSPTFSPILPADPGNLNKTKYHKVRIEFLGEGGDILKIQSSSDPEIVSLVSSLVKSNSVDYCKSTVNKICDSGRFKELVEQRVYQDLSRQFQKFISNDNCPLRIGACLARPELLTELDFDALLSKSYDECPNLLNAISIVCLGCQDFNNAISEFNRKHHKQRLLAILAISAFSRNQKVNIYQKVIGEFLKRRNTSKHCLQYLQRVGLSLVTMSIRSDQEKMGVNFLQEVQERKSEIELWAIQRQSLEKLANKESVQAAQVRRSSSDLLAVSFVVDDEVEPLIDISEVTVEDAFVDPIILDMISLHGSASSALELHLDGRPKLQDVTYDNIGTSLYLVKTFYYIYICSLDIGCRGNEYMMGDTDQSKHWTSSIIVEGKT
jgi:hypothetical protein